MGDFWWSYNQGPGLALDARFHGIKDTEGTTHRLIIAETANGSTSFDQFISEEGAKGYQWFKQSANTVYDYGSNSVEQFDKVYNQTGATRYPVVDIEPPYVNAPHYKDQQNQELRERNYSTFIRGGAGINFGHEKWWPTFPDDMPSQFLDHLICRRSAYRLDSNSLSPSCLGWCGSSITSLRPRSQGSSSSANGTLVDLPAPGGA